MTFAELAAAATKNKEFAKEEKTPESEKATDNNDEEDDGNANEDVEAPPEVYFTPIVKLEHVEVKTLEEDEEELFKMRAKMFRFEKENNEWKERGTGEVRLLKNPRTGKIRLVMRRDQTLKVCANHMVTPEITLRPNVGSDRSWVYNVLADVSDGESKPELFAIRFANSDNANQFKSKFEECQKIQEEPRDDKPTAEEKAGAEEGVEEIQKELETVKIGEKTEAAVAAEDKPEEKEDN